MSPKTGIAVLTTSLSSQSGVKDDVISNLRGDRYAYSIDPVTRVDYLWYQLAFENNTPNPLTNLTFYAANVAPTSQAGTAFNDVTDAQGNPFNDAATIRNFTPVAASYFDASNSTLTVNASKTQFQALLPSEADELTRQARLLQPPALQAGDHALEYGFTAFNASGGRTIAPGETGYVVTSFRQPLTSDGGTYNNWWEFILATDSYTRASRAPGETTASAVTRAQAVSAEEIALVGNDGDLVPSTFDTVRLCDTLTYVGQPRQTCTGPAQVTAALNPDTPLPTQFIGEETFFGAAGPQSTLATYTWTFGDGSSAQGPEVVHTYTAPGQYTATLTVVDSTGRTTSANIPISVMPEIHLMPSERAATAGTPVVFDVKLPVTGFAYEWDFGDGTPATRGAQVSHSYPRAGFYEVGMNLFDTRAATLPPGSTERWLGQHDTRINWVVPAPSAFITGSGTLGGKTIDLDGSGSTGSGPLTYQWDFGDGSTAVGVQVTKTYIDNGRYPITLTVTDTSGQTDVANQLVITGLLPNQIDNSVTLTLSGTLLTARSRSSSQFTNPAIRQAFERAQHKANPPVLFIGRSKTKSNPQNLGALATSVFDKTYAFPFVAPVSSSLTATVLPTPAGAAFLSSSATASFDTTPVARGPTTWNLKTCDATSEQCQEANLFPGFFPNPLPAGVHNYAFSALLAGDPDRRTFTTNLAVVQGLRVPRVILSVVPDEQLPGGQTTVKEYRATVGGTEQMFAQVSIPYTQVTSGGYGFFRLPVYAVDAGGALLESVSGVFKASFHDARLFSAPIDNLMVRGRSSVLVYVPLDRFSDGSTQFDLSSVDVQSNPDCSADAQYGFVGFTLQGCTTLAASTAPPRTASGSALPNITAYPYPLPANFLTRTNRLFVGKTPNEALAYDRAVRSFDGKVAGYMVDLLPVLEDSPQFLAQVHNGASARGIDPVLADLAATGLLTQPMNGEACTMVRKVLGCFEAEIQRSRGYRGYFIETGFLAQMA